MDLHYSWCLRLLMLRPLLIPLTTFLVLISAESLTGATKKEGTSDKLLSSVPILTSYDGSPNYQTDASFATLLWHFGSSKTLKIPQDNKYRYKLIVDVGLLDGSKLICLLKDPSFVFIGFEAHLVNFGYSYSNMLYVWPPVPKDVSRRVLMLPLGAGNTTGIVNFNENNSPSCGSILESKPGAWHCATTSSYLPISSVRLEDILSRVPSSYSFYYLKVDIEGADHLAIYGAGDYVSKFEMVSIECPAPGSKADVSRHGVCKRSVIIPYMTSRGFASNSCGGDDCHFAKDKAGVEKAIELQAFAVNNGGNKILCQDEKGAGWNHYKGDSTTEATVPSEGATRAGRAGGGGGGPGLGSNRGALGGPGNLHRVRGQKH